MLQPRYFVDGGYDGWYYGGLDMGYYQIWEYPYDENEEPKFDFFDVPTGYFSGVIFDDEMIFWNGSRLVPVTLSGRICYVDRHSGELAFFLPDGLDTNFGDGVESEFVDGFTTVCADEEEWEGIMSCNGTFIISDRGEVLDLSGIIYDDTKNGLYAELTQGGLMAARDEKTGLLGYYDLNKMDWRVPPQFLAGDAFSYSGFACVELETGSYGHIDTQGNLLAQGFGEWYHFLGDYAYLKEKNILIDAAGETVISFPEGCSLQKQWDNEMREGYDYYVSPEGLMEVYYQNVKGYGVMNLQGAWVLPPQKDQYLYCGEEFFSEEGWRFFSDGLQAVRRTLGISGERTITMKDDTTKQVPISRGIGYINTQGETVIDYRYDDAGAFLDGLASVERDGQYGYVDRFGHEIGF